MAVLHQQPLHDRIDALLPTARRHGVQLALEVHKATITPSASLLAGWLAA